MLPVIHVKLRTDKSREGKHPVILQLYYEGKQKQVFTGIYIEPSHFTEKPKDRGKYITGVRNKDLLNATIANKMEALEKSFLTQSLTVGHIDLTTQTKTVRRGFSEYANEMFDSMKNKCVPEYIYRCKRVVLDFENFAGKVGFLQITTQLLQEYEDHLFGRNLSRNTVNKLFRRIKQVFAHALRNKVITENPFNVFRPVTARQTKREFLTMDQITLIENKEMPEELDRIRNYFLLSCYTGLRYVDLSKFDKKTFITKNQGVERIIIGTTKTKEVVSIKLTDKVKALIDKINTPLPTNVHTNRVLKEVGKMAEIDKPLTFHMGRHSFAVNCATLGIPIEAVSKLLGHSSIRTTSVYYKLTDTKIDEYMDRWI